MISVLALVLVGCQTTHYSSFAPFDARLEPVPGGGARYLVLLNTSGQELHNLSFSAYVWNENNPNPLRRQTPFKRYLGSTISLEPGRMVRFREAHLTIEDPLVNPITRVEIVGKCDQGSFRQGWENTETDQLRPRRSRIQDQ